MRRDLLRLIVEGHDGDVDVLVVIEDVHNGAFVGRRTLVRLQLVEFIQSRRFLPDRVGHIAVNDWRFGFADARCRKAWPVGLKVVRRRALRQSGRCTQNAGEEK